jgi:hypothetical protein
MRPQRRDSLDVDSGPGQDVANWFLAAACMDSKAHAGHLAGVRKSNMIVIG